MQIYLIEEKKRKKDNIKFRLPVLPPSIEIGNTMLNTTVNIINLGEVNLIGKKGLTTVTLSSFFPNHKYMFAQYKKNLRSPSESVHLIQSWMNNPIKVIITSMLNMEMTIESFTYSQQDSSGDINYTIELKEYKKPKLKIKKSKSNNTVNKKSKTVQSVETKRKTKNVESTTYIVKSGDTLSTIAKKLTGSSSNYRAIANQNHISNPSKIAVGQKLVIKV